MKFFTSADLQRRTGEVQTSAAEAPIAITDYNKPRNIILSVTEYVRLKQAVGERVPEELVPKRPVVLRPGVDALGYNTRDLAAAARQMASDASSGRTEEAVMVELERVRTRLDGRRR
jgi:hypothetical protein